jgi:hypothetical protein
MSISSITVDNVPTFIKAIKYLKTLTRRAFIVLSKDGCLLPTPENLGDTTKVLLKIPGNNIVIGDTTSILFEISELLNNLSVIGNTTELTIKLNNKKIHLISKGEDETWDLSFRGEIKKYPSVKMVSEFSHSISVKPNHFDDCVKRMSKSDTKNLFKFIVGENGCLSMTTNQGSISLGTCENKDPLDIEIVADMVSKISKAKTIEKNITLDIYMGEDCPILFEYMTKNADLAILVYLSLREHI